VLLGGCVTHLASYSEGAGPQAGGAVVGAAYSLPMLQYDITIQRTLARCEAVGAPGQADFDFILKVVATPHFVAGETYNVFYPQLSDWTKVSDLKLEIYDNQVIKSVNASAEDQSGAIIGDVVKTGVGILSLVSGVPLTPATTPAPAAPPNLAAAMAIAPKPGLACTAQTKQILADAAGQTALLERETAALTGLTNDVARFERAAAMGALSEAMKDQFATARTNLEAKQKAVVAANLELSRLVALISGVDTYVWPRSPAAAAEKLEPTSKVRAKLEGLFEQVGDKGAPAAALSAAMVASVRLDPARDVKSDEAGDCHATPDRLSASEACKALLKSLPQNVGGVFYRAPVPSRLLVCRVADAADCTARSGTDVIASEAVLAPQLGRLRVLPLRNGPFQNNSLSATFRQDGSLATFGYADKAARAKVLSGAVAEATGQVLAFRDAAKAKSDADAAAAGKVELDRLDAEIARQERQNRLADLRLAGSTAGPSAAARAELAQLEADLAILEAKRKIRDAQAGAGS
jgi:hypothetical protein